MYIILILQDQPSRFSCCKKELLVLNYFTLVTYSHFYLRHRSPTLHSVQTPVPLRAKSVCYTTNWLLSKKLLLPTSIPNNHYSWNYTLPLNRCISISFTKQNIQQRRNYLDTGEGGTWHTRTNVVILILRPFLLSFEVPIYWDLWEYFLWKCKNTEVLDWTIRTLSQWGLRSVLSTWTTNDLGEDIEGYMILKILLFYLVYSY